MSIEPEQQSVTCNSNICNGCVACNTIPIRPKSRNLSNCTILKLILSHFSFFQRGHEPCFREVGGNDCSPLHVLKRSNHQTKKISGKAEREQASRKNGRRNSNLKSSRGKTPRKNFRPMAKLLQRATTRNSATTENSMMLLSIQRRGDGP